MNNDGEKYHYVKNSQEMVQFSWQSRRKEGNTPRWNWTKTGLVFWSAEYDYFDPILEMDEVLEFVSPSHSELEWLDGPQE